MELVITCVCLCVHLLVVVVLFVDVFFFWGGVGGLNFTGCALCLAELVPFFGFGERVTLLGHEGTGYEFTEGMSGWSRHNLRVLNLP